VLILVVGYLEKKEMIVFLLLVGWLLVGGGG
jgi:hypothetical protein